MEVLYCRVTTQPKENQISEESFVHSSFLSFGRMMFRNTATIVATTTGDFANTIVTQSGKWESASVTWEMPTPRAADKPTIEVFR